MAKKTYKYNTSGCEYLKQGGWDYVISPKYHYIKVGDVTINQLKEAGLLPSKNYESINLNKPDGFFLHGKNTVVALVEYKKPGEFSNIEKAFELIYEWYYKLAQVVNCNAICITDGNKTYWFHAKTKKQIKDTEGNLFSYLLDISKFTDNNLSKEEVIDIENTLDSFSSINNDGQIVKESILNPQALAVKVWQKIWVDTGKEPEKCLYNVVEIFIFKFLSDLGILEDNYSFDNLYKIAKKGGDNALKTYARQIRPEISEMFPKADDGTSIINGTIFVNENGSPNLTTSSLFNIILKDYYDYGVKYGSFKFIDKNFKTRLYESFLRQSAGISALGQYFTPRNVVKAIVKMSNGDVISDDATIGDPFCGVGGFVLEFINEYDKFKRQFTPVDGKIEPRCTLLGYDKGTDERDDQRTIILAKANMLIYLSDFLVRYKDYTKAYSEGVFNKVFHLIKSNLGTFGLYEKEKYDLILTNPPYVTSGVSALKTEIKHNVSLHKTDKDKMPKNLNDIYSITGNGLEGLALSWIIFSLKTGGSAFIIVPDGIMNRSNDTNLRNYITQKCYINGIISLPTRTFFATPKQTYILSITKKEKEEAIQDYPVFTYLVSEIGETRDSKRFPNEENDLNDMVISFRQFMASKHDYTSNNPRCKMQPINRFINSVSWMVEKDWSDEDRKKLGIDNDFTEISEDDFVSKLADAKEIIDDMCKMFKKRR